MSNVQLRRLRQAHPIERWNIRLPIEDRYRLAAADGPKIFAQTGLQFGDSHLLHAYI
jgi:hypothetical protein